MNPIEQVWREVRTRGFRNKVFRTLSNDIDRLCHMIFSITPDVIWHKKEELASRFSRKTSPSELCFS